MSRRITVRNQDHPKNIMYGVGQQAKKKARSMSNTELDELLNDIIKDNPEALAKVLVMPRHKKIKLVRDSAMYFFADQWNKRVEAAKGEQNE